MTDINLHLEFSPESTQCALYAWDDVLHDISETAVRVCMENNLPSMEIKIGPHGRAVLIRATSCDWLAFWDRLPECALKKVLLPLMYRAKFLVESDAPQHLHKWHERFIEGEVRVIDPDWIDYTLVKCE